MFSLHVKGILQVIIVVENLNNLDDETIKQIQEGNYYFGKENLNAKINYDNVIQEEVYPQISSGLSELLKYIIKQQEKFDKEKEDLKNQMNTVNEKNEKDRKEINEQKERIQILEKEREEIYSSKRWRYTEKISKFLHKKF